MAPLETVHLPQNSGSSTKYLVTTGQNVENTNQWRNEAGNSFVRGWMWSNLRKTLQLMKIGCQALQCALQKEDSLKSEVAGSM